jgi:site-specific DNA recombinase
VTVAIYARKSTDQAGVAEDAKSVTRQVERGRAFATAQGWTVAESAIFIDDGISGAEFEDRPGLARLVVAAKTRPRPFDILVTMDQDRIGRDQVRTLTVLNDLVEAGCRVVYYATGAELRFDSPTDNLLVGVVNFGNEWYRHQVRLKTYDALRAKAERGHVAGGTVYGYRNVPVLGESGRRAHVTRVVEPTQAKVVEQIFTWCAGGKGVVRIARTLNAAGTPPSRPNGRGWAPTAIREILHRELLSGTHRLEQDQVGRSEGQ